MCRSIYDPRGLVAPIVGGLKLDVSKLHRVCKGWGDPIPNELKECWAANFDVINELADIEFNRAVIPSDAVDMSMETLNVADAGDNLVCAAVYVRFLRRDGSHSCQLIFARTKVIHDHTTPRGEVVAAVLNASTGFVVKSSLKDRVKRSWYVTDSQVTLYLINSTTAALKTWPRNRVVEVNRLSNRTEWYHTRRQNMVADLIRPDTELKKFDQDAYAGTPVEAMAQQIKEWSSRELLEKTFQRGDYR